MLRILIPFALLLLTFTGSAWAVPPTLAWLEGNGVYYNYTCRATHNTLIYWVFPVPMPVHAPCNLPPPMPGMPPIPGFVSMN